MQLCFLAQKFLCGGFDRLQVGEVEVQIEGFVPRLLLELANRFLGLHPASRGDIDFGSMGEENLVQRLNETGRKNLVTRLTRTLAVSLPMPVLAPVTRMTLPERSGMSWTSKVGLEGKASLIQATSPFMTVEVRSMEWTCHLTCLVRALSLGSQQLVQAQYHSSDPPTQMRSTSVHIHATCEYAYGSRKRTDWGGQTRTSCNHHC